LSYSLILVEDEFIMLKELEMIDWKSLKVDLVAKASNGIEGEKVIEKYHPDIVITDIRLPGQDGLEMLSKFSDLRSVILSGFSDYKYMKKAIKIGVEDYLLKPVDNDELLKTISNIVKELDSEKLLQAKENIENEVVPLERNFNNHLINSAVNYISENYSSSIGLQEAAAALNVSETHLSRLFKEVSKVNFLYYLNAFRINKSIYLLKNSTINISEIAFNCGFLNPGYYTKIFKRFLGITPTSYREKL
jgi:two-component system response regulator YesN